MMKVAIIGGYQPSRLAMMRLLLEHGANVVTCDEPPKDIEFTIRSHKEIVKLGHVVKPAPYSGSVFNHKKGRSRRY